MKALFLFLAIIFHLPLAHATEYRECFARLIFHGLLSGEAKPGLVVLGNMSDEKVYDPRNLNSDLDYVSIEGIESREVDELLTTDQIETVHRKLRSSIHKQISVKSIQKKKKSLNKFLKQFFGEEVGLKIFNYFINILNEVSSKTDLPFHADIGISNETSLNRFPDGHIHHSPSLTVARTFLGHGTWIIIDNKLYMTQRDSNELWFTDQFHGTPIGDKKRLLFLISFRFEGHDFFDGGYPFPETSLE